MNRKKLLRIAAFGAGLAAVVLICAFSGYMIWEEAPAVESAPEESAAIEEKDAEGESAESLALNRSDTEELRESPLPLAEGRKEGVYTVLLAGNDDGNGNTDTIIVGRIDTVNHCMDFVSIPRDTLINVDWEIRKINSVYWGDIYDGGNGIDALKSHVKKLIGFDVDCYAVMDLSVFVEALDAMGGVYFDVPQALDYEDAGQELYIHLQPGYQLLNGYDAMCLCRYRSGYTEGDIDRISMQQRFLKSCAEQFIDLGNVPNISAVVKILSEGLHTDMTAANIAFFLRQALLCDSENINFYTVPHTPATVHGLSYATVDVWDWLQMVNARLNPYEEDVGWGNVDIVYKSGGDFFGTAPLKGSWYYENPRPAAPAETLSDTGPETGDAESGSTGAETEGESPAPALPALPEFTFPPLPGENKGARTESEEGKSAGGFLG